PIMQWKRIGAAITAIRKKTGRGTINLNTNGSVPGFVAALCKSGLDSIRISLSSAREELYNSYYRPRGYSFDDVVESIRLASAQGVYTMINYLVFPGITDQEAEVEALCRLIRRTGPHLIHFKNLNIDPDFYLQALGAASDRGMGIKKVCRLLEKEFPELQFGYYNRTREAFSRQPKIKL
ncbi:MAG: radical SAM protein, partial [Pseudomonadota bacterium]